MKTIFLTMLLTVSMVGQSPKRDLGDAYQDSSGCIHFSNGSMTCYSSRADEGFTLVNPAVIPEAHAVAWDRFEKIHTGLFVLIGFMYLVATGFILIAHAESRSSKIDAWQHEEEMAKLATSQYCAETDRLDETKEEEESDE